MTSSKKSLGEKDSGGVNPNLPIGPGNPPLKYKFAKGQPSANPHGRPLKSRNLKTELTEELNEEISVREGGRAKRISKARAIVKTSVAKALQGSDKAALTIFNLAVKTGVHEAVPPNADEISAGREAIVERFRARARAEAQEELRVRQDGEQREKKSSS
jgi:hypothetical protein